MEPFKDFFTKASNRRHRKPILGGTDLQKKHLNIVGQKYKKDNSKNYKIETLKQRPGKFVVEPNDMQFILQNFLKGRKPLPGEFNMLGGKLGIKLYFDHNTGKWMMEKN